MARSGGHHELGDGVETLLPILPRANLEDGTARAIRSLLHREMTAKISARSAQMAMERLVPKLEPAKVLPTVRLDRLPTPTSLHRYREAMRSIYRTAMDGECEVAAEAAVDKHNAGA